MQYVHQKLLRLANERAVCGTGRHQAHEILPVSTTSTMVTILDRFIYVRFLICIN